MWNRIYGLVYNNEEVITEDKKAEDVVQEKYVFPMAIRNTETEIYKYGWVRDLPDQRDYILQWPDTYMEVENRTDLRETSFMPKIYNQGRLGSCTANAIAAAYEYDQLKQELEPFSPSRLFIYYNERMIEGTVLVDAGASIRDGIKTVNTIGVCPEEECPYEIMKFWEEPSQKAYIDAGKHKSVSYRGVDIDIEEVKALISLGHPIVFGFTVYESFEYPETAKTGIMPMPAMDERVLGGHAVLIVGYDCDTRMLIVRNSWGEEWGQNGYFMMPFEYFTTLNCADAWIITSVEESKLFCPY